MGTECFCGPVDYTGPTCDQTIDDCQDVDCANGTCLDRVRDYACNCDQGWTIDGDGRCTVEILSCSTPNACIQGTCDDSTGAVLCDCDPGFQGTNCNVPINCGTPPDPPANAITGAITGTEFGDVIRFDCLAGFGSDSVAVMCQADGTWEVPDLSCEPIDCGAPDLGQFNLAATPDGTGLGALAIYFCGPGFIMYGSDTRACGTDGQWSGSAPRCVIDGTCADNPCVFGLCTDFDPSGVVCLCSQGWTGPYCTLADDP